MKQKLLILVVVLCLFSTILSAQVIVHAGIGAIASDMRWEQMDIYGGTQPAELFDVFGASVAVNVFVAYGKNFLIFADETFGLPLYATVNGVFFDTSLALMRIQMDTIVGLGAGLVSVENFKVAIGVGVHNHMLSVMSMDYTSTMPILPFGLTLGAGAVLFADMNLDERTTFFIKASAAYDFFSIYGLYRGNGGLAGTVCAGIGLQLF